MYQEVEREREGSYNLMLHTNMHNLIMMISFQMAEHLVDVALMAMSKNKPSFLAFGKQAASMS